MPVGLREPASRPVGRQASQPTSNPPAGHPADRPISPERPASCSGRLAGADGRSAPSKGGGGGGGGVEGEKGSRAPVPVDLREPTS